MAQPKKYGAFAGVFTPSILTILGVIMYMRMPWIAGQAGLFMVIGIVLVAHVVSICTGLSVSSIATDKKVEGGGSYYILSRSLGLSIGGTLGIALFFGLSFSVSLYIIGFSESFNNYWGFANTVNSIRMTGSIVLLLVTALTFISTSLAMKCQFFILGAIALSLLSLVFGPSTHVADHLPLYPQATAPAMMVLFGIFFPAVTGFEAGVSMSGDLKDPKKAIPLGTMVAIMAGLAVYIALPFFLLSRVDATALVNNPNILLAISIYPPLVIAGIWAATISSAIGSILGAPRILQATAVDSITPKFFSKGHGKDNEPRNALMVTFMVAEAGILIGELDIIARVVSTFFITTYGFLNLSCAVERWASSDFRPSFRVPKWVSILGFLTCLIVMIELDILAMIGGILILGGLLFFLKSRELTLKSGDVWESVWLSIVRMGLFKLSHGGQHQRNWKPNILLFSGESAVRPHLIEFGKWTAGQLGMVSNFDLIETPSAKELFPKSRQATATDPQEFEGVFIRRQECRDIYEGINTIVRTYGFSGIEPNTILMGWGKKSREPEKFFQLLKNLNELDSNLILMNYHDQRGFGAYNTIDIWWRGAGNNGNLALALAKFILASMPWRKARLRFLIVTHESALIETIYKNMARILEESRLDGDIKVINNAAEERSFNDIIAVESGSTDLTILGLPDFYHENAQVALESTSRIISNLGTTLMLKASSFFNEVVTGIQYSADKTGFRIPDNFFENLSTQALNLPALALPNDELLSMHISNLDQFAVNLILQAAERHFLVVHDRNRTLVKAIEDMFLSTLDRMKGLLKEESSPKAKRAIAKMQGDLFFQFNRLIAEFKESPLNSQKDMLEEAIDTLLNRMVAYLSELPEKLTILHPLEDLQALPADRMGLKWLKRVKRLECRWRHQKHATLSVRLQHLAVAAWAHLLPEKWRDAFYQMGTHHFFWVREIQRLLKTIKDFLAWSEVRLLEGSLCLENIEEAQKQTTREIAEIQKLNDKIFFEFIRDLLSDYRLTAGRVAEEAGSLDAAFFFRQHRKYQHAGKLTQTIINEFPGMWWNNQSLLMEGLLMDLSLMRFTLRLSVILKRISQDWFLSLENGLSGRIKQLLAEVKQQTNDADLEPAKQIAFQFEVGSGLFPEQAVEYMAGEILPAFEKIPETARALTEGALQQLQEGRFVEMDGLSVDLRELLEYVVYAELLDPLRQYFSEIPARIETIIAHVKDAARFLSYHLSASENSGDANADDEQGATVDQAVGRIEKEKESAAALAQELRDTIDQSLKQMAEKINPHLIIRSSDELRRYIRFQESKKVISIFEKRGRKLGAWMQGLLVKQIYQRNPGILKIQHHDADRHAQPRMKEVLAGLEAISPKPEVLHALPFHYRQLFLSDQPPSKDFWVGRQDELAGARTAIERFKAGTSGALMVTGDRFSGKSALSLYIAEQFFPRQAIFQIYPPGAGSCSPEVFHRAMETALQLRGNVENLFLQIPSGSVIVFHSLELWWERHPDGNAIMNHLEWIIREFGQHCFFILNINPHALKLILNMGKIEEYFLDIIQCAPLPPEQLKDLILLRHRATGLKFNLGNQPEEALSELQLAHLFRRVFDYSKGNIGVALQSWVSHIDRVERDVLTITPPSMPEHDMLMHLPLNWLVVILQFVLHRYVSKAKLMRLMAWDAPQFDRFIDVLCRAGIVQVHGEDIWKINPFVEPLLIERLQARKML